MCQQLPRLEQALTRLRRHSAVRPMHSLCTRVTSDCIHIQIKRFEARPTLVARCYTAVDSLKDLLLTFDQSHVKVNSIDALATSHTSGLPVV